MINNSQKSPQKPIKARIGPYGFQRRKWVFHEIKGLAPAKPAGTAFSGGFWPSFVQNFSGYAANIYFLPSPPPRRLPSGRGCGNNRPHAPGPSGASGQSMRVATRVAMSSKIRKAVFPVGGLGTRFLPATKAMPKEMLPVVDRPLIQYAVDEARDAGIEEFIFVTGRAKSAIEDHFDHSVELEGALKEKGSGKARAALSEWMPEPGQISYTRQQRPLGLGHAVWCARYLVGDEPFAVLLADDLILAEPGCLAQMIEAQGEVGGNLVAVEDVPPEHTDRYGILDVEADDRRLARARGLVEKPDPASA